MNSVRFHCQPKSEKDASEIKALEKPTSTIPVPFPSKPVNSVKHEVLKEDVTVNNAKLTHAELRLQQFNEYLI